MHNLSALIPRVLPDSCIIFSLHQFLAAAGETAAYAFLLENGLDKAGSLCPESTIQFWERAYFKIRYLLSLSFLF